VTECETSRGILSKVGEAVRCVIGDSLRVYAAKTALFRSAKLSVPANVALAR
jgi:hypothetical protein